MDLGKAEDEVLERRIDAQQVMKFLDEKAQQADSNIERGQIRLMIKQISALRESAKDFEKTLRAEALLQNAAETVHQVAFHPSCHRCQNSLQQCCPS